VAIPASYRIPKKRSTQRPVNAPAGSYSGRFDRPDDLT
jgi:hypothetical protein